MHIEIWKGSGKQPWRWHKISGNKIVSSAEGFPSKSNAMRAAKNEVRGTIKRYDYFLIMNAVLFTVTERNGKTRLTWA